MLFSAAKVLFVCKMSVFFAKNVLFFFPWKDAFLKCFFFCQSPLRSLNFHPSVYPFLCFIFITVCKDSYVVYACGFDRVEKREWVTESMRMTSTAVWQCNVMTQLLLSSSNDVALPDSCCTLYNRLIFNLILLHEKVG